MEKKVCKDCQCYLRHYTFDNKRIFRVHCGHCTHHKAKAKRPDAKACEDFIPGESQENAFASKEYLSKELLQYMLKLELLPNIEERQ